jgi:hypothetical protein
VDKIDKAIQRLEHLHAKRMALHEELKRSLALQKLWPDAFDHDRKPTTQIVGNPRRELTFNAHIGDEHRSLPLEDVPTILWSNQVKADIRELGPFGARRYYKILQGENNGTTTNS